MMTMSLRWKDYFKFKVVCTCVLLMMTTCIWFFRDFVNSRALVAVPNTNSIHLMSNLSKRQLCIESIGRLGNNMFLFASAYGIARTKGMQLTLISTFHTDPLLTVFNITSIPFVTKCPKERILDFGGSRFDPRNIAFKNNRDLTLYGYFQSWIYFVHVEIELRRIFAFKDKIKERANLILGTVLKAYLSRSPKVSPKHVSFVGVHVRRGDLLGERNVKLGYVTASSDYFQKSMLYFRKRFSNPVFVVCSGDIQWPKRVFGHNGTFYVHESFGIDLAVLAQCNHSISSIGTFSWWSAWLTKGIKLYYPYQSRPGSWLESTFSRQLLDYFPFDWIPITNTSALHR